MMSQNTGIVESAVMVPEPEESAASPSSNGKRRHHAESQATGNKRSRLLPFADDLTTSSESNTAPNKQDSSYIVGGRTETDERQRGKRLFGALLGTLSQNPSSVQQRRVDIERKQKEKLKSQAEKSDQLKNKRLEDLLRVRREEHEKYKKQSIQLRHSNMLAAARFLQTKAEPQLYYKPWKLSIEETSQSQLQIEQAESAVKEESEDPIHAGHSGISEAFINPTSIDGATSKTVGDAANSSDRDPSNAKINTAPKGAANCQSYDPRESRTTFDEGDDVVEGEEDTVIY